MIQFVGMQVIFPLTEYFVSTVIVDDEMVHPEWVAFFVMGSSTGIIGR